MYTGFNAARWLDCAGAESELLNWITKQHGVATAHVDCFKSTGHFFDKVGDGGSVPRKKNTKQAPAHCALDAPDLVQQMSLCEGGG